MEDLEFLEHNINNSVDISLQQDENIMNIGDELFLDDIDIKPSSNALPKAVHQCNICNKIFVSFKGLQQHAIIHTDIKPFTCEICNKSFRFKSNLFEHRSIHSGFVAHACPICGKTCRLKGNLKKHLKTHLSENETIDELWKPFASNRRPPAEVPHDAIIVRSSGDSLSTPVIPRHRKRKLGLGTSASIWIDKIQRGLILSNTSLEVKMQHFLDMLENLQTNGASLKTVFDQARNIAYENFQCPICNLMFPSRGECSEHLDLEHPLARVERPMFCEICLKSFVNRESMEQHESYHKRVHILVESGELVLNDPDLLIPNITDDLVDVLNYETEQKPINQSENLVPLPIQRDSTPVEDDQCNVAPGDEGKPF